MSQTLPAVRRLVAACAGAVSLAFLAPAWSACNPAPAAGHPFEIDEGVVHDISKHLTWQRCSVGQHFDDGRCHGSATKLDWAGAKQAATRAGEGWRLPSETELATLLVSGCSAPATDTRSFPETLADWYWSSTQDGQSGAWFVDFADGGGNGATVQTGTAAVRLVRAGGDGRHDKNGDR